MVTSGLSSGIEAATGKAGALRDTACAEGSAGADEGAFSNVLDSVSEIDSKSVTAASADAIDYGKAAAEQAGTDSVDTDTTTQSDVAAELLAMLGSPLASPEPTPIPLLIAAAPDAECSAGDVSLATAMTGAAGETLPTATSSAIAEAATGSDLQWLRMNSRAMLDKVQPSTSAAAMTTNATETEIDTSAVLQADSESATATQTVLQTLLTQVVPMAAIFSGRLLDEQGDAAKDVAPADALNAVSTAASLQPAGTQLATDTHALELSSRHQLHAQVGSQPWATELANKLTLLATKDTQSATLYMTPADLGPVQVRIDLNQDQASVWFTAEHAETRSALEQSLPRLRELFTAQGMSLTDAGVFGDRSGQQAANSGFNSNRPAGTQYATDELHEDMAMVRSISLGLLDAYA